MQISIKNLEKFYGDHKVLDIDNLTIEQGKITGLVGPNGCGKTTLLNIIAGLDKEFQGQILYNEEGINGKIEKNMTLVFQKPYLLKRKVYDNIEYPLKLRNFPKEESKKLVEELLEDLEIVDLKNKKGHLLSGGESQKVALARALVFQPQLLLLDEPTSNIDPQYILTMERAISSYNLEKKGTIIMVTHNIEQAERLCHNVIKMDRGKVVD